jgi:hypothetical protein
MATSADRDDRDEDEKDEAEEKPAKKQATSAKDRASASRPAAKDADEADEEDEEDEEEDEEDEEDDEEEEDDKPAPKSAEKASAKPASKRPAKDDEEEEDEEEEEPAPKRPAARGPGARGVKGARGPGAGRARVPAAPSGSLGKSVALFFVIVIGLGAGFAILGREPPQEVSKPKWKVGEMADVEVTLVRSDRQDLACASAEEVAGKHCAFEAQNKPFGKGDPNDDKTILKPYTTMDRVQFTAAGLWVDPGMAPDKLPATRFSVKCKYKVEGSLKNVAVRWEQTGQWYPQNDWYAGTISDCKLTP